LTVLGFNGELVLCEPPNGESCICVVTATSLNETLIRTYVASEPIKFWVPAHWIKPFPRTKTTHEARA
jgi:hypothetical protein